MANNRRPYPSVGFPKQVRGAMADNKLAIQTLNYTNSGELTSSVTDALIGVVTESGELNDFIFAVADQGQDGVDDLKLAGDLKVNGTSVISGEVVIEGASGEAGTAAVASKPTFSSTSVSRGDRLTLDLDLTRTTPVGEITNVFVAVKVVPVYK